MFIMPGLVSRGPGCARAHHPGIYTRVVDFDNYQNGVHPNSHKHFIPYMGFCASIWDSVRHHCHHHHHHHDHLKWTVKQQRRRPKNLWANFKRLGWMDISILRHGPALDGRQT